MENKNDVNGAPYGFKWEHGEMVIDYDVPGVNREQELKRSRENILGPHERSKDIIKKINYDVMAFGVSLELQKRILKDKEK